ncbi:DM13 domain-containing protein [Cohnella sp.]|uniref:DM13 domain-containing protein n=1 Tax=Cohnella sp. TaxID=1883426 RepID=UPI003564C55A
MKHWKRYAFTGLAIVSIFVVWRLASPLFLDHIVNEELPIQAETGIGTARETLLEASTSSKTETTRPVAMPYSGEFRDADQSHHAAGMVKTVQSGDLSYLRLEQFDVTNGPDLYVYLTKPGSSAADGVQLAKLKGNIGDQNYELPEDIDLSEYSTVVIYCKAFSVDFGYAELKPL